MASILPFAPRHQLPIPMPPPADRLREAFRLFVERCDNDGWEIIDRDHTDPNILSVELHHPAAADLCVAVAVVIDQTGTDCPS